MTLDDLRALDAAATKGPWRVSATSASGWSGIYPRNGTSPPPVFLTNAIGDEDAALIAATRNALPALLAIAAALPEDPWFFAIYNRWYCGWCLADRYGAAGGTHKPDCRWLAATTALATLEDR